MVIDNQQIMNVLLSSESTEYYTPPWIADLADKAMGGIDLDPASCDEAQDYIDATEYFTIADDGLSKPWHGNVWLNPPYTKTAGQTRAAAWAQYAIAEHQAGRVEQAIILLKAACGYQWFEGIWREHWTCFARDRISFIRPGGDSSGAAKWATCFLYLGDQPHRFAKVFRSIGRIIPPEDRFKW